MQPQETQRCPHFQLHSEPLAHDGPPAYLAIRHCLLTERMLHLLKTLPEAQPLAQRLVIRAGNAREYAFVGPDLEAVTQQDCAFARCQQRCTPAYKQMLAHFEVIDPGEEAVTCEEGAGYLQNEEQGQSEPASSCCTGEQRLLGRAALFRLLFFSAESL